VLGRPEWHDHVDRWVRRRSRRHHLAECQIQITLWQVYRLGQTVYTVKFMARESYLPDDRPIVGERIRTWRRYRGMPLKTLAGLAGISVGLLSEVENGKRILDRRSQLTAVAAALQVSTADLTDQPGAPLFPEHAAALATVPAVRSALVLLALDDEHTTGRELTALRRDTDALQPLRAAARYDKIGPLLPDLLRDLGARCRTGSAAQRREALRLMVRATYCATYTLKYLGHRDLAMTAAEACGRAATELAEPAYLGLAAFTRLHSLPPETKALTGRLAGEAADRLQPHLADADTAQVYGMLHLSAAFAAAVTERAGDTHAHLAEADAVASRTGEGEFAGLCFGPTNIGFWRVAIAVELGEGGRVDEIARQIRPEVVDSASRRASFFADLGRGYAQAGADARAVEAFCVAERLAPQRIRASTTVRETVGDILRRARREAGGQQLRALARRVGVV
jgi:transcriptional regulator with XRE-family HTH domain